ncbi:MAG: glucose 1-dehydrogenase [Pseudomonadota bacterium]
MQNRFTVNDKVVLITGGSRGLGKAMSIQLAECGAKVVVASRKIDECQKVAEQIQALGGEALALACHVGHWDNLEQVVEAAYSHYGRIDVLVNNAGMSPLAPSLLETSEALFDKIIEVNLKGPTRLTALVATRMGEHGGGSIINISSLASLKPNPLTTVYSAAKAGLNVLTAASAQEYASLGVRVNCVICGTFETDATAALLQSDDMLQHVVEPVALKRMGDANEVVGAIIYFASEASSYTTGSCVTVDGGVRP